MNYLKIEDEVVINGEGVRVTLFVSGCSHRCKGCQNPESWNPKNGSLFTDETIDLIINKMNHIYIDGLTLTGGDPLYSENIQDITKLVKKVKETYPFKTIWLYTGWGYKDIEALEVLKYIDVLIDGPFIEEKKDFNLKWRGSSNQKLLYLRDGKIYKEG